MQICRANLHDSTEAQLLLSEYYDAIGVLKRDTPQELSLFLSAPEAGFWIASEGTVAVGCVALRRLPFAEPSAECKRLYVRPAFRGLGVASALLDSLEAHASASGYQWVYLDSTDDLQAALRLYLRRDYRPCERYNDNPQATHFLRKDLRVVGTPGRRNSDGEGSST